MATATKADQPIEVFFSYSHKDETFRQELIKHLSILRRQGVIAEWHDRKITAGSEWAGEIDSHLNTADVILLLISSEFLASDYCYDIELKRAMERHDAGEARVIPIILRSVDWSGAPFGKLQALPRDAKPVTEWPNRDAAFTDVAKGIRAAITAPKARPVAVVVPVATLAEVSDRELREAIVSAFSLDELALLCADIQDDLQRANVALRLNLDIIGGSGIEDKAQRLIEYLDRRSYRSLLVAAVRRARPRLLP